MYNKKIHQILVLFKPPGTEECDNTNHIMSTEK